MPANSPDTVQVTVEHMFALNRACEAPFRERLAALLEQQRHAQEEDVACLVADAHLLTLMDVARGLGVPTLVLRTGGAACFRWFMAFPKLCDKGYLSAQGTHLRIHSVVHEKKTEKAWMPTCPISSGRVAAGQAVDGAAAVSVRDLPSASGATLGLMRELISRAVTAVKTSSGLIINTFDALEADELASLRHDLAVPVFDIGPLYVHSPAASSSLLQQDRGCLDWLDAQGPASVLYVSFGSLASMSAADLVETAWGIANSGRPFLWVLRPGLVRGAPPTQQPPLPDGFDAETRGRGMVVSWAPQEEVLAHPAVGALWTHCGWNSTLEGVCAGVPMLCRPCFGDQMGNARYVDHVWRTGVSLDGELERGKVEAAISTMMGSGESEAGTELRGRARELSRRAAESVAKAGSSDLNVDKLVNHILSL
ncbi:unnamed protein product [Miscanthus lutarioriparius]|uniref:Uncharacterized protein n=1 Tax=Miscanthus lutarioriparius TaxID=422564 RepID=A0A811NFU8_9POAL|nr:unnamed protein product [Miscanthus lutarioriparius]